MRWHARMEDALVIFHQLARDERQDGSLGPLARIKVDEKKCYGMIEWRGVRKPQSNFCPNARRAVRKYRRILHAKKERVELMPCDTGDKHGEADECSLPPGVVAAEMRARVAKQQAAGHLSWERPDEAETGSDPWDGDYAWYQRALAFRSGGSTHLTGV